MGRSAMLKAYVVSEKRNHEASELVFAETPGKAKVIAQRTENFDCVSFNEMTVNRAKYADGHEKDSERDLLILKMRNGWWCEIDGRRIDGENVDEALANGWI